MKTGLVNFWGQVAFAAMYIIFVRLLEILRLKVSSFRNVFLVSSVSPKKRMKTCRPEVSYVVVKSNFFVPFLGELRRP